LNPAVPGQGFSKLQKNSPAVSSTGVIFILPEGVKLTRLFHYSIIFAKFAL